MRKGIRKSVALGVILLMIVGLFGSVLQSRAANIKVTPDEAIARVGALLGTSVGDQNKGNKGQCVGLMVEYCGNILGIDWPHIGVAADIANTTYIPEGLTRIEGAEPKKGDILVYLGTPGSPNFNSGHVAIYISENETYHQNYNGKQYVTKEGKYNASGITKITPYWGVLRPDFGQETTENNRNETGTQTVADGSYHIASALGANLGLDVAGASKKNGANIQVYKNLTDAKQIFRIKYIGDGYYSIISKNSGLSLDVAGGGKTSGTNVHCYKDNSSDAQKWIIKDAGSGYVSMVSKCNGLYVDVSGGVAKNSTNVQMYKGNGTKAQKWRLIPAETASKNVKDGKYHIVLASNPSYGIDVAGASTKNGANIQLYKNVADPNQVFEISYTGKQGYKIVSVRSKKVLDVYGGNIISGTNIWQYKNNNSVAQRWRFVSAGNGSYYIVNCGSNLAIDIAGGIVNNGTNIWAYVPNKSAAQKWKLVKAK